MNANTVKSWLLRGELEKLENVVLEGKGSRLLGEYSPDLRTKVFLKGLPNYLNKITQVHDAVTRGALTEVQKLMTAEPKKKLALAKDSSGTPLLHKAVCYDQPNVVEWLVQNYPATTQQKDREGRTALHYCAACKDPEAVWDILIENNCDASICDKRGNPAAYYLHHPSEIELPELEKMVNKKIASAPKEHLDLKPSNIRIWIHNRDIGKLQQVLWEGHGMKLRRETSSNPRVKKFLEAIPFIMGTIKDVHAAVVNNDLEQFRKTIADPVSPAILCSKDFNGLNVLHKAVGLGHTELAREIMDEYSATLFAQDNEGRTPLHFAAALKDDGIMYNLLVEYGADESKLDNKMKAPAFYKNRPSDIDFSVLTQLPEAPRVSGTKYPKNWDWRILETDENIVRKTKKMILDAADSAFGSAESSTKATNENTPVENEKNAINKMSEGPPKPMAEEFGENVTEVDFPETKEVTGESTKRMDPTIKVTEPPEDSTVEKAQNKDQPKEAEILKVEDEVQNSVEHEDKTEPSTGDSGVDDTANDEDQAIVGEHGELPDSELNDGGMVEDSEADEIVQKGNMEQLAALVLNGEGRRLVGRHSSNPELQAFIDNVPAYMGKIHAVHMAAREGNLRDLQSALDRRKFAIARDGASPHGATPLHVATIFGNTAIIRYLAGRFPETAHAVDVDGRTPLHYAATLADNGHYYNLLLHLGANPLVQDNFGQKAEYYKQNQSDLSHKKLLRDFGARENLADEILTDKENSPLDVPMFREDEGQYLASSLGDPLIKGLTEVANARPKDPVTYLATYLYNFASKNKSAAATEPNVLIIDREDSADDDGYPQSPDFDGPESNFNSPNRDEHGQTLLHFAAQRSQSKDAFFHMMQEARINVGLRDEVYRTARDVAEEAQVRVNIEEIDRYVVYLAARGETEMLVELLLEGYDHIIDATDNGVNIIDVAKQQNHDSTVQFLESIPHFLTRRDKLHDAIRAGNVQEVKEIFDQCGSGAKLLAVGKNAYGRCSLHIAVLKENEDIVRLIAKKFPETLRIGDNLQRTALHYAMGVPSVEILSNILIKAGAKRVQRDLKSRQPSYYFMNKMEIEILQKQEGA